MSRNQSIRDAKTLLCVCEHDPLLHLLLHSLFPHEFLTKSKHNKVRLKPELACRIKNYLNYHGYWIPYRNKHDVVSWMLMWRWIWIEGRLQENRHMTKEMGAERRPNG